MIKFEVLEPSTIKEAISLLEKYGSEAMVLAGGTDLIPHLNQRVLNCKYLINIKQIPGLQGISSNQENGIHIGALTKIRTLEKSPLLKDHCQPLWEAAGLLGSVQVRNLATIGGNLCNAAPSAEMAPPLLALDAQVKIASRNGQRIIPLKDFFLGPGKTALGPFEILLEINLQPLPVGTGGTYYKLSIRKAMDIAIVGVASVITLEDGVCKNCRIALGAVAPTPIRAIRAEKMLEGQKLELELLDRAAEAAMEEARPISDHRSSAEYRREMVRALTIKTVQQAALLASGNRGIK